MNNPKVAAALRLLADAIDTPAETADLPNPPPPQPAANAAAPVRRGRGRPVKGEGDQATAVAASPAATEPDPFAAPAAPATSTAPTATIEDVRKALTDLKTATSQDIALGVLKSAGGVDNLPSLPPGKYGEVVAAAAAKQAEYTKAPAPAVVDDPFAVPAAEPEKVPTIEELKALIIETQKRTSPATVQKLVMDHGGKAVNAATGAEGPSLTALPAENYVTVAKALKALPTTK